MYKVVMDNKIYVKLYEQYLFGGGVVHFTENENNAGKFPEMVAREISSGLRSLGKDTTIIKKIEN